MAIRHYRVTLTAVGPVHIGDGSVLGKGDYFQDKGKIAVLDMPKFIKLLDSRQLDAYCELLDSVGGKSKEKLQSLLDRDQGMKRAARASIAYRIDSPLATARRGSIQYYDVAAFVKDAYGLPYVPGSSLKGMIRTIILTNLILDDREAYVELTGRSDAGRCIENAGFRKEFFPECESANDVMRYVSVSDSEPLSTDDLAFVKKYDKFSQADDGSHKKGMGKLSSRAGSYEGNELNIYRECLRPETRIRFTLDVDDRIDAYLPFPLNGDGLRILAARFYDLYSESFLSRFDLDECEGECGAAQASGDGTCCYVVQSGPLAGTRCRNRAVDGTGYCNVHKDKAGESGGNGGVDPICFLGGGVGFGSKTVVNALFESEQERVAQTAHTLYGQFPTRYDPSRHRALAEEVRDAGFEPIARRYNGKRKKDDHRHWMDGELGVSPHTVKLGIIGNKKYLMGKCTMEVEEIR